jgi:hypothetical protein
MVRQVPAVFDVFAVLYVVEAKGVPVYMRVLRAVLYWHNMPITIEVE